ncbi:hypothetical protein GTY41_22550 [Streptomyces sp. SID685]|uniref:hypothetical protein n=1 Tax=Streptomyces sp. SID685 TaxID=2690322 RepID=UPI00136B0B97|nr:hypothetical protein [Streptomyces sp. SID685]MYR87636.1 hypothetical protein [Streptomyces sp. SID685]
MCPNCGDFYRTVFLLGQLALYADMDGADLAFVDAVTPSLVVSLSEPPSGILSEDLDRSDGPDHPDDV